MKYFKLLLVIGLLYSTGCTFKSQHHITLQHNITIDMKPVEVKMNHNFNLDDNRTRERIEMLVSKELSKRKRLPTLEIDNSIVRKEIPNEEE